MGVRVRVQWYSILFLLLCFSCLMVSTSSKEDFKVHPHDNNDDDDRDNNDRDDEKRNFIITVDPSSQGIIDTVIGFNTPYNAPERPDVTVNTSALSIDQSADFIFNFLLRERKLRFWI